MLEIVEPGMQYADPYCFHGKTMGLGIKGKKIFLSGTSRSIGARLAERLTMTYGAQVHALVLWPCIVAKQVLGWSPRVSFQEALDRTCQWRQYAGYKD